MPEASHPPLKLMVIVLIFLISKAVFGTQVMSGSVINDCVIKSYTNCNNAYLKNQDIQGAFLAYAKLNNANMEGANLMLGDMSYVQAEGVNLSGASLSGIAMNHAHLKYGKFIYTVAVTSANSMADMRYADFYGE